MALVAYLDWLTGIEIAFSIFYILPISLVAWHVGVRAGTLMALFGSVTWFAMDYLLVNHPYSNPIAPYWNAAVRMGLFLIIATALARLRTALALARETARLKSDMLSFVSHEFGNSLGTIGMGIFFLEEDDSDPAKRRRYYGIIKRGQTVLKHACMTFLNEARMESGRFQIEVRHTELRTVIRDILEAMRPLAEHNEIAFELDLPPQPIPIRADPDALAIVMANLIGNAIKYTPEKGRVCVRLRRQEPSGGVVEISVEDTGIGIAGADLERIFSGFERTAAGIEAAKGFGIGLKVARTIIESHGSRLNVQSVPGSGSRFYFELPVWREEAGVSPIRV